ncbi:hypothetical protein B481_2731 [Planococcus halocryophilus Or1]|nr:hypothetical protein B481_2731 [Planococcus halocryophilus Or1]
MTALGIPGQKIIFKLFQNNENLLSTSSEKSDHKLIEVRPVKETKA